MKDIKEYVAGLRGLADFLEDNRAFAEQVYSGGIGLHAFCYEDINLFRELISLLGHGDKVFEDNNVKVVRHFGPHSLAIFADRDTVCHKRLVEKTITVEEWDCPEVLEPPNARDCICADCSGAELTARNE